MACSLSQVSFSCLLFLSLQTITSIRVPDKSGKVEDIVLGFDTLEEYESNNSPFLGVIVGRCANRIAKGEVNDGVIKGANSTKVGNQDLDLMLTLSISPDLYTFFWQASSQSMERNTP